MTTPKEKMSARWSDFSPRSCSGDMQKGMIARGEQSRLIITVHGVDYLEENYSTMMQQRRLPSSSDAA